MIRRIASILSLILTFILPASLQAKLLPKRHKDIKLPKPLVALIKKYTTKQNKVFLETDAYLKEIIKNVKLASSRWQVPEHLIYAVIARESGFYTLCVSSKDCYGLMQVNYKVWKDSLKISRPYELYLIDININHGTRILKHYYEKYGSWYDALRGYFGLSLKATRYAHEVLELASQFRKALVQSKLRIAKK